MKTKIKLLTGDCVQEMAKLDNNSIDAIVTDPPYGLKFMGKEFDDLGEGAQQKEWHKNWAIEALRVLKPGGHLLAFGGTRTYHHLATAVEEAGFEIRDQIQWLYGTGFPKSMNLGNKNEKLQGWGTALKPANEPCVLARKPFKGTVAENVQEWGTGAINIDKSRIGNEKLGGNTMPNFIDIGKMSKENIGINKLSFGQNDKSAKRIKQKEYIGRWPANIILDEEAGKLLDEQSQIKEGPSRFFYCPKASKKEKNAGLDGFEEKKQDTSRKEGNPGGDNPRNREVHKRANHHPTVKPVALMVYLIRLITPPGGTVLDPFLGSGSTGLAAIEEDSVIKFIGIEQDPEYMKIAKARIDYWQKEND